MATVWIAERDWGDGRTDFIGAFSNRIRAIAACEKAEADMPVPKTPLTFVQSKSNVWHCHIEHHYDYTVFETAVDSEE